MKKIMIISVFVGIFTNSFSQETSTFKDPRDGKVYKTIKIGNQIWMAENLIYKPSDGNYSVSEFKSKNNNGNNVFYDWKTALNVCPAGWHLPSADEWQTLFDFSGGDSIAGKKLKRPEDWDNQFNLIMTDSLGFGVFPAGYYDKEINKLMSNKIQATFWTSKTFDNKDLWAIFFYNNNNETHILSNSNTEERRYDSIGNIIFIDRTKYIYYSIRCLKN